LSAGIFLTPADDLKAWIRAGPRAGLDAGGRGGDCGRRTGKARAYAVLTLKP
jgi:hypothetical protein